MRIMKREISPKTLMFYVTLVLFNMAANFAHPVTPTIFTNLNLGSYMFGVALGSMMIFNFLFSPFWGKINTYISSRKGLLIGAIGYALGQLFFGLAQTEIQFMLARMFAGLFTSASYVSILTYTVNTAPDERARGRLLTTVVTIQAVGGAFGFFVGGMLGEVNIYLPIYLQVAVLALSGVSFFFVCKDDSQIPLAQMDKKQFFREANPFSAFMDAKKFMTVLLGIIFIVTTLQNLGGVSFDQSFNYYIKDQFGFTSGFNGALKGIMGFITLAANSTISIWLINKTDVRRSIIGVLGCCAVTLGGIVVTGTYIIPFVIFNVLFYAFNSVSVPLIQNAIANSARGEQSNLVMGFYNSTKALGGIIGSFASGGLYAVMPILPFVMCLVSFALGTGFATLYYIKGKRETALSGGK